MFERFSDRARHTVVLAQEEARHLGHSYIGTEHLLLGLLREGEGLANQALRRLGVSLTDVRADVIGIVGEGNDSPSGHIPFTPRSKKVLELSLREALQLGHNYIGTEHILLGLVREGEGVAAQVLIGRGAALDRVRAMVLTEIGGLGRERQRGARQTPAVDEAIADAKQLAGASPMGSHHLLEALARSDDSLAGRALAALGVDAERLAVTIDEIGTEGTSDATPEEAAARLMELRVDDDGAVHVVLRDQATVDLVRSIVESYGGPVTGEEPATGSMANLWQAIVSGLEELRGRIVAPPDDPSAGAARPNIVRQAIQSRLARRRRDR